MEAYGARLQMRERRLPTVRPRRCRNTDPAKRRRRRDGKPSTEQTDDARQGDANHISRRYSTQAVTRHIVEATGPDWYRSKRSNRCLLRQISVWSLKLLPAEAPRAGGKVQESIIGRVIAPIIGDVWDVITTRLQLIRFRRTSMCVPFTWRSLRCGFSTPKRKRTSTSR
jgi:hypothetical protein